MVTNLIPHLEENLAALALVRVSYALIVLLNWVEVAAQIVTNELDADCNLTPLGVISNRNCLFPKLIRLASVEKRDGRKRG